MVKILVLQICSVGFKDALCSNNFKVCVWLILLNLTLSQGKQRNRDVQNERVAKATATMNRIGMNRSNFTPK